MTPTLTEVRTALQNLAAKKGRPDYELCTAKAVKRALENGTEHHLSAGPHGEHGKLIKFPERTHLLDVKKKAAEIIINAYKHGDWYFHLRDASNGEGCRECAVTEKILEQSQ